VNIYTINSPDCQWLPPLALLRNGFTARYRGLRVNCSAKGKALALLMALFQNFFINPTVNIKILYTQPLVFPPIIYIEM